MVTRGNSLINISSIPTSCVITGFRREVDKNCPLLVYYAASSGNSLPMFQDNLSVPSSTAKKSWTLIFEDGTDRSSRNIGMELTLRVA